jgi:hypothetical protein
MIIRTRRTYRIFLCLLLSQPPFFSLAQTPNNYGLQVGYGYSVGATILKGDTMFIGGDFDCIGFNTSSIVGIDINTGAVNTTAFPFANRAIRTAIPDGTGGYYIGGDFSTMNGYKKIGLAHIKNDHTLDQSWDININDGAGVYALLLSVTGDTLWVGGTFSSIGGVAKDKVAAIKVSTRTVLGSWGPGAINKNWWAPGVVCALAWYPGDVTNPAKLLIGGDFANFNWTVNKANLAALNPVTGTVLSGWQADITPWDAYGVPVSPVVRTLLVDKNNLYIGGLFKSIKDATNTTYNQQSLTVIDVRGNGTYNTWTSFKPDILPVSEQGYVNTMQLVNMDDGSGNAAIAIGGKFTKVHSFNVQSFTIVGMTAGNPLKYQGGALTVNGRVVDTTFTPNVYASGEVYSFFIKDNLAYLAGDFEGFQGDNFSTVTPRRNLAAFDMKTNVLQNWAPAMQTNMPVRSIYVNNTEVMAAGSFTTAGVQYRRNLAAVDLKNNVILPFNPRPDSYVNAFELSTTKDTLYIGGNFSNIGASQRGYTAAFKVSTGALLPWSTTTAAGGGVEDIKLDPVRNILYVGGKFTTLAGQSKSHLAAINSTTGSLINTWTANVGAINGQITPVRSIALSPAFDTVFVGGRFNLIAGQARSNLAAIATTNPPSGATASLLAWNFPVTEASSTSDIGVNALAISGGRLYVGGKFTAIGGNTAIQHLAAIRIAGSSSVLDGSFHPAIAYGGINSIVPAGASLYIGGDFGTVNEEPTSYAAAVRMDDGSTITAFKPYPTKMPVGGTILTMLEYGQRVYLGGSQENMNAQLNDAVFHIATSLSVSAILPLSTDKGAAYTATRSIAPGINNNLKVPVWLINRNTLRVTTPARGYSIRIFTAGGQLLYCRNLVEGMNDIPLQPGGAFFYAVVKNGFCSTGKIVSY